MKLPIGRRTRIKGKVWIYDKASGRMVLKPGTRANMQAEVPGPNPNKETK